MDVDRLSPARRVALAIAALAGIAAVVLGMVGASHAAGWVSVRLLRSLDMLSPDAYYDGTPFVLQPALWLLAVLYALPALVVASTVSLTRAVGTGGRTTVRQAVDLATGVAALFASYGIVDFAFDPSRSGRHEALVRRHEELPYEGADLIFAATWTMLGVIVVLVAASTIVDRPRSRVAIGIGAVVVLTPLLGAVYA